jgi:CDP-diacylglycerol--glycerol-3-phosphate 3-phosphatidyltransferase
MIFKHSLPACQRLDLSTPLGSTIHSAVISTILFFIKLNFPNTLSILRIILSPVFVFMFLSGNDVLVLLSFFVFTIAALTDWYDGWYARKYGFKTRWGQFLDPLADKVLTSSALLSFFFLKYKEPHFLGKDGFISFGVLIAVIITRDIVLTLLRSYKELKGQEFKTSMISKTKTFIQMTYIFIVIGLVASKITLKNTMFYDKINYYLYSDINYYFMLVITVLTIGSGIAYFFESSKKINSKIA